MKRGDGGVTKGEEEEEATGLRKESRIFGEVNEE